MDTKPNHLALLFVCGLLISEGVPQRTCAQQQQTSQPSVAEAARRARAQKEKEAPVKPVKVFTNDDLKPASQPSATETAPQPANAAAQPAPSGAAQTEPGTAAPSKATPDSDEDAKRERAAKEKELADLKKQLQSAQSDLNLYQREFALQRDTYYSNPDYVHDTDGKAKLDSLQQQINDKAQSVDELKLKVSALQELLGIDAQKEAPTGVQ